MANVKTIADGKFKIQTVGPMKNGTGKTSGKPWKTYDLQFEGDGAWYTAYWNRAEAPVVGEELEGKKEYNEDFKSNQFNMGFGANKANWNPAGANAQVMMAAVAVVNGFLSLKPAHLTDWEAKRKEGQTAVMHYLDTVTAIAGQLKQEVVKMGGNEIKASETASKSPTGNGDPGPMAPGVETWPDGGEELVDLGGM